jgi:hypothetical protein
MDTKERLPISKQTIANVTIEELESRLEMTLVHLVFETAVCCDGGCHGKCCQGGGNCLAKE